MPFKTAFFSIALLFFGCQNGQEQSVAVPPFNAQVMPSNATPVEIKITDLNCWVEQGQFFITGICSNETALWQRIWLNVVPRDAAGAPLKIKSSASAIVPTFSDAVPPKGRTSFLAGWPLADFSAPPANCTITCAGAQQQTPGPILLFEQISGVKMLKPLQEGQPATEEVAWQINALLSNPLPLTAKHPRLELLLYGTDNKLWLSTLLNPEDPQTKPFLALEKDGPIQPGEKRSIGITAYYDRMPQALKALKIGRVEVLGFEGR